MHAHGEKWGESKFKMEFEKGVAFVVLLECYAALIGS
jgi:hypothetical protein